MKNIAIKKNQMAENAGMADLAVENNYLPEMIYNRLPEPLGLIVKDFAERERDIIFLSSLAVLSSVLPNVYGVYDRKQYFPNLYLFIIAPPASGKGVMNWGKNMIEPIHERLLQDSKEAIRLYNEVENPIGAKPKIQLKIVPANMSASKFYSHMENAHDSLLIFESEADSLSNMLKQEWGNFSDVMRKAFHHETISISRQTDDLYFEIKNPKLSIVLSGTPNQLKPLIDSKDNGLFSRFMFYYFEDVLGWKDVSPNANFVDIEELFLESSNLIYELYGKLYLRDNPIEVKLTKEQWDEFQSMMILATETFILNGKIDFISVIKRMGVMFFKICMVLSVLRNQDNITDETTELICADEDIQISIILIKNLVEHSLKVFDLYNKESVFIPMNERILFNKLPDQFKRFEGVEIARKQNIAERTFGDILKRWQKLKILEKIQHGAYQKIKMDK